MPGIGSGDGASRRGSNPIAALCHALGHAGIEHNQTQSDQSSRQDYRQDHTAPNRSFHVRLLE